MKPDADTINYTPEALCGRIANLTSSMMDFWKHSHRWAPMEASGLLNKSMTTFPLVALGVKDATLAAYRAAAKGGIK